MDGLRPELALDDDVRLLEACFYVAQDVLLVAGDVRVGLVVLAFQPGGGQALVENRRVGCHGGLDVHDRRQDFVLDLDERQRLLRLVRAVGGDGGDRVSGVQGLVRREYVVAHVAKAGEDVLANFGEALGHLREVPAGRHGSHAGMGLSRRRVQPLYDGVGVRAAQDLPVQHAGQVDVRAVTRRARHLLDAVVPNGSGADNLVLFLGKNHV